MLQALDRAAVVGGVADRALERVGVERGLRQVVDGARLARRLDGGGAAGIAEEDELRAGVLLQQPAHGGVVAQLGIQQHRVVRMLAHGRERGRRARRPVHLGVGQQVADHAAVGLVGGDEEQDEGRLGHGPAAERTYRPKCEQ